MKACSALAIAAYLAHAAPAFAVTLQYTPQDIASWEKESFKGVTRYGLEHSAGRPALRAQCDDSASGLILHKRIDIKATPIVEWSWRVDHVFAEAVDEATKAGDDYPARLYFVKKGGPFPWRTRAINYAWASHIPEGADWPNAYASQAHMIAVRAGTPSGPGIWETERRNIREDFQRYHGIDLKEIYAIAVMTDCDNLSTTAEAWYGPIRFLSPDGSPEGMRQ